MNGDFSELIEYLDKKFQETAAKEDLVKLVTLEEFDRRTKELEERLGELKEGFGTLQSSVDTYAKLFSRNGYAFAQG